MCYNGFDIEKNLRRSDATQAPTEPVQPYVFNKDLLLKSATQAKTKAITLPRGLQQQVEQLVNNPGDYIASTLFSMATFAVVKYAAMAALGPIATPIVAGMMAAGLIATVRATFQEMEKRDARVAALQSASPFNRNSQALEETKKLDSGAILEGGVRQALISGILGSVLGVLFTEIFPDLFDKPSPSTETTTENATLDSSDADPTDTPSQEPPNTDPATTEQDGAGTTQPTTDAPPQPNTPPSSTTTPDALPPVPPPATDSAKINIDVQNRGYTIITVENAGDVEFHKGQAPMNAATQKPLLAFNGPLFEGDNQTSGIFIQDGVMYNELPGQDNNLVAPDVRGKNFADKSPGASGLVSNNGIMGQKMTGEFFMMSYDDWQKSPPDISDIKWATQNGPILYDESQIQGAYGSDHNPHNPNTSIKNIDRAIMGYNSRDELVYIHTHAAKGFNFHELGDIAAKHGLTDAIYLDGTNVGFELTEAGREVAYINGQPLTLADGSESMAVKVKLQGLYKGNMLGYSTLTYIYGGDGIGAQPRDIRGGR